MQKKKVGWCVPKPRIHTLRSSVIDSAFTLSFKSIVYPSAIKYGRSLLVRAPIFNTTYLQNKPINIWSVISGTGMPVVFFNQSLFHKHLQSLVHGFLFLDTTALGNVLSRWKGNVVLSIQTTAKKTIDRDISRLQIIFKYAVVNHKKVRSSYLHSSLKSKNVSITAICSKILWYLVL